MGKFFKDSYASTYATRNVKEALDKLIDVLQSPAQVRKLVIGSCVGPRKPGMKLPGNNNKLSFEFPANTPLCMEKQTRNASKGDAIDAPPASDNSTERKKTTTSSAGGSQTSDCSDSNADHIPVGRFSQLWKKSLRDYPSGGSGGSVRNSRERQRSSPPQLEAGWSSVPCKSGDFDVGCSSFTSWIDHGTKFCKTLTHVQLK